MRRSIKIPALIIAMILSTSASATGIDSRSYMCGALHNLIASKGFVFIGQSDFGDFVVAGPYYCGGGEYVTLRSVPTRDRPECPVNYCQSRPDAER